ncbi:unnamed protein product [Hymenolepis diminuta]|uniref:Transmembrane 9 superfamily member n=2 Tax=Hymenolepis diminuta TaxID=6216 RepID=A0A0R3SGC5_HYMDI|nr:unnamed protein product [Hymenolepis diminuta]
MTCIPLPKGWHCRCTFERDEKFKFSHVFSTNLFMFVYGVSPLPPISIFLSVTENSTEDLLNLTTALPIFYQETDASSFQLSVWVIVIMSITCFFTIAFILCGLFKRADAYHVPLTAAGEIDIANLEGLGLQGNEGMFGISGSAIGWV